MDSTPAYTIYVDGVVNGQSGTTTNNTALNLNITALAQGTHSIIVQAADDTGNDANSTALTVTVDTTNPTATINSPTSGTVTNDTTPSINFTLTDNLDTTLRLYGVCRWNSQRNRNSDKRYCYYDSTHWF